MRCCVGTRPGERVESIESVSAAKLEAGSHHSTRAERARQAGLLSGKQSDDGWHSGLLTASSHLPPFASPSRSLLWL